MVSGAAMQAVRLLTSNGSSESAARSDRREGQDRAHSISFGLDDAAAAPSWLDCLLAEDDCSAASGPADQPPEQPRASACLSPHPCSRRCWLQTEKTRHCDRA